MQAGWPPQGAGSSALYAFALDDVNDALRALFLSRHATGDLWFELSGGAMERGHRCGVGEGNAAQGG